MNQVVRLGSNYAVIFPNGRDVLVTMAGGPATFDDGWTAIGATTSHPPVVILHLLHSNGTEATWFLDAECRFLGGTPASLSHDLQAGLRRSVRRLYDATILRFLTDPCFGQSVEDGEMFLMSVPTLVALSGIDDTPRLDRFEVITPESCRDLSVIDGKTSRAFDAAIVEKVLQRKALDVYLDACRTSKVEWLSPLDGRPVDDVRGIVLWNVLTAWRCVDRRNNFVFFVFVKGFANEQLSILIHETNLVSLTDGRRDAGGRDIEILVSHLLQNGRELTRFLSRPTAAIAHFIWGEGSQHIGHHHYNELSGLEQIVDNLEPYQYPLIYDMAGTGGGSFYGDLLCLFPEFGGLIDSSSATYDAMSRHAYRRGIQILKFGGRRVTAGVRQRIRSVIARNPAFEEAQALRGGGPVVVFGLRVENRTFNNPVEFFTRLAKMLIEEYGRLTIIVDGHNTNSGRGEEAFPSFMDGQAAQRPIDIERQIVVELRSALRSENIKIVDCIGMTIVENLAWMAAADYCVAPWGAGLAKYRWALNIPSYVIVGNLCKRVKSDINIYVDPAVMDSPTPLVYASDHLVTDCPDSPVLVRMDEANTPFYVNYDMDVPNIIAEILNNMRTIMPA